MVRQPAADPLYGGSKVPHLETTKNYGRLRLEEVRTECTPRKINIALAK